MRITKVVLALLLITGIAMAQNGLRARADRGQGSPLDALKTYLILTDQQIADIRAVQVATREAMKPVAQQVALKAKALREELKKDPVNAGAVTALRSEIEGLRAQIKAAREGAAKKTRDVLNATQLGQLNELEKALALSSAARQAVALNLLDAPEGVRGANWGRALRARRAVAAQPPLRQPRKI